MMLHLLTRLAAFATFCSAADAGAPIADESKAAAAIEAVPLNTFRLKSSYVFESDFDRGTNASGDAWENSVDLGHRFPLDISWSPTGKGNWYLRAGANYSRFDFGNSGNLPLPDTLQSFSAVIALEYFVAGEVAILLQTSPGFYFEDDVTSNSFDAPTKLGVAFPLTDRFFLVLGGAYSGLRSYPILPALGFFWRVNDEWTVRALVPEPRIIYRPSDNFRFWAGGELTGGSFRTDNDASRPGRLRNATLSYSEFRAGAGVTIGDPDRVSLELGGGYAFNRKFDYHRADDVYNAADGAPYVNLSLRGSF